MVDSTDLFIKILGQFIIFDKIRVLVFCAENNYHKAIMIAQ